MTDLNRRALATGVVGTIVLAVVVFGLAGTLHYWQGWLFLVTYVAASAPLAIWLAATNPALLERRMRAGPAAESEPAQKLAVSLLFLGCLGIFVLPPLDHRFGWSSVPVAIVILGDILIALSFLGFYFVLRENSFSAATVQVSQGQQVISTGPYGMVRHPMYTGALVLLLGIPLALGSWWGLVFLPVVLAALLWRIFNEEAVLRRDLPGYAEYMAHVRWRLLPGIF